MVKVILAVLAGAVGAVVGGYLVSVVWKVNLYVPFVPGAAVGYLISVVVRKRTWPVAVAAGVFGFVGMVFGDSLTHILPNYPGTWNYFTHFWLAWTPVKVSFWVLNVVIAVWFAGMGEGYVAARSGMVMRPCPKCGSGNSPAAKFCGECGESLS